MTEQHRRDSTIPSLNGDDVTFANTELGVEENTIEDVQVV